MLSNMHDCCKTTSKRFLQKRGRFVVQDKFVWGVAGPLGFEPRILGSGGRCLIRTRLRALFHRLILEYDP